MHTFKRLLFLYLLVSGTYAFAQCNPALRVGFITGLSGEGKVWGDAVKNGFELGLQDANCATMARFYEDDQFVPVKSISAFRKLVEQDKVNVVVVTSSATGNAVAPLAQARGVALFAWASDVKVARGRPLVVRTWSSGESEGEFIAQVALKEGYRKVAAFSTVHDYPVSVWNGFSRLFPAGGVVLEREFPPGVKDYRTEILAARAKNPDALYTCLMVPGDTGIFAKQARELGLNVPIFGCEALELGNFDAAAGALTGAWYVTGRLKPAFEAHYRKNYGAPGTLPGAAIHYDLARILSAAGARTPDALVEEVLTRQWESMALQSLAPFRSGGDQALRVSLTAMHFKNDGAAKEGVR